MIAKLEKRYYAGNERVWVGEYKNLHNISHWHMEHELILCKTGTAHITLNEHEYSLTPGKGLLCYSGNIHSINAGQDCVLFVSLIDERTTTSLTCGRMPTQSLFHDDGHIQNQLMEIRRELYEKQPFFEQRTLALMILILVDIYRAQPLIDCQQENEQVNRYKQLLNRVDTDYSSITFDDAVEFMNFSPAYFSRYFKKQAGMTFSQYLSTVRVEKAVQLIHSEPNTKITEICASCWFTTIRNFNREFRRITGYTPKELPKNFVLNTRTLPAIYGSFDPTLSGTELIDYVDATNP